MKKLFKSTTNKKICGVCGGIGEYFKVDPTLIRLLWIIISLGSAGLGIANASGISFVQEVYSAFVAVEKSYCRW